MNETSQKVKVWLLQRRNEKNSLKILTYIRSGKKGNIFIFIDNVIITSAGGVESKK